MYDGSHANSTATQEIEHETAARKAHTDIVNVRQQKANKSSPQTCSQAPRHAYDRLSGATGKVGSRRRHRNAERWLAGRTTG